VYEQNQKDVVESVMPPLEFEGEEAGRISLTVPSSLFRRPAAVFDFFGAFAGI